MTRMGPRADYGRNGLSQADDGEGSMEVSG